MDSPLKGLEYPEAVALSGRMAVVLRARTAGTAGLAAERRHRREAVARVAIVRVGVVALAEGVVEGEVEVFSLVVSADDALPKVLGEKCGLRLQISFKLRN